MKIPKFEGNEVVGATLVLKRAGDGLSKAVALDPMVLKSGQTVDLVIRCTVGEVGHKPIALHSPLLNRKHELLAETIRVVTADLPAKTLSTVDELLTDQVRRIEEMSTADEDEPETV